MILYELLVVTLLLSIILNIISLSRSKGDKITPWTTELKTWNPTIKVKYFNSELIELGFIEGQKSNWIDLRCAENVKLKAGDFKLIPLGVAMELPIGYEAHVIPRSSTFANWGVIQTNSTGLIDEVYKGDNDEWFMPVYATRDTEIKFNDRICQFRIVPTMGYVEIAKVDSLGNTDRGGHGTTGTN